MVIYVIGLGSPDWREARPKPLEMVWSSPTEASRGTGNCNYKLFQKHKKQWSTKIEMGGNNKKRLKKYNASKELASEVAWSLAIHIPKP